MKKIGYLVLALITTTTCVDLVAQDGPPPSPKARIEQAVGFTNFSIDYFRPGVKGRELFVEVEAWDKMWRTGANSGTIIEFDKEATIAGNKVAAGKYLILSIPGKEEWTWILYSDVKLGGYLDNYDKSKDVTRWTSKTMTNSGNVERLTFNFADMTDTSAKIFMRWGKYSTSFDVTVN
ncbi:MAG: DUF2911 domain-containing protein [Bacteroidetes bacterium]|nr:DUF2911 domain-containing protein [Bacteroidota bacterium]